MTAGNIGRRAAQRKAAALFGPSTTMKLATVASGNNPAYYVFNAQRAKKGFVIVAGEEQASDDILGYSESGEFDPQDMPPALQYMLQCYAEQTEMVRNGEAEAHRTSVQRENIDPLIQTKWNQNAPFNSGNVTYSRSGELFPTAGCVATAMAQIIRYYASPVQTTAIPAYTYWLSTNGLTFSRTEVSGYDAINIPGLPATTFNYDIMEDYYETTATGESIQEVAKLMAYCGRAVEMHYTLNGSSAGESVKSFTYFGFNPNGKDLNRSEYTSEEWDNLVYAELQAKRPVLYSGGAQSAYSNSGHAFVCDGYKDGLFHINWGWSGRYDGFFKLSECNPYGTGTGGSNSLDGYSFRQAILTGIQPNATAADPLRLILSEIKSNQQTYTRTNVNADFTLSVTFKAYNINAESNYFDFGVGVFDGDKLLASFIHTENRSFGAGKGNTFTKTLSWGKNISSGTYKIKAISRVHGETEWQTNLSSGNYFLTLTIDGTNLTVTPMTNQLKVNSVTFEGYKKPGKLITVRANVSNSGTTNTSKLYLFVDGILSTGVGVNVDAGTTEDVLLHFISNSEGNHSLALYAEIDDNQLAVGTPLWNGSIELIKDADPNLSASSPTVSNMTKSTRTITGTTFQISLPVTNNASVAFDDELSASIYKVTEETGSGYSGKMTDSKMVPITLVSGETKNIVIAFENLIPEGKYWMTINVYKPSESKYVKLYNTQVYTIKDNSLGIGSISADQQMNAPVFNLNGQRIQKPQKGIYIMNGRKYMAR